MTASCELTSEEYGSSLVLEYLPRFSPSASVLLADAREMVHHLHEYIFVIFTNPRDLAFY